MIEEKNSIKNEKYELLSFLLVRKLVREYAEKYYETTPSAEKLDVLAMEVMDVIIDQMDNLNSYETFCDLYKNAKENHSKYFVRKHNEFENDRHEFVDMDEAFNFFKYVARRLMV